MAYNPYRASYGLPPPILPSAGKPAPQGMAPMQPPPLPPLQAPLRIQNPQPNTTRKNTNLNTSISSIRSSNRSAVSILSENFRLEDQLTNGFASNKQQREAMKAFDPQRIREIKGSRRAQQMVSSALAGGSPSVPGSSPPARTVSSNPPSKNGSTNSLFGGLSPIAKVDNKRKRKTRKISRKSQKQLKNRKHK
uniref:Uncharacterized protein n=1 Tax=viral metagenome TaxID=1070528 RepID=A0A6C0BK24_9ZZZZ